MGLIIGACTYPHFNIADAFVAEAQFYEQAVRFAQELGFQRIQIEGDSLMIIKRLHSCTVDRSVLGPNVVDIKGYFLLLPSVLHPFSFFIQANYTLLFRFAQIFLFARSWLKVWHLLYLLYHFRFFLFLKNCLSHFGKFVEIQFDRRGRISGAAIRTYLLERSRVFQMSDP
ncbi:hypothetical protein PVK06_046573 [Gossypium arboreum]|uniref:Myosin motor domain-containing protein n=1 Tax=Gossypium arboreum TaxID=29729 RepID=A0ABR0MBA7_GOSAR|nr:hypothetical protein PVK06_046573 [Gossypium arboreum]